MRKELRYPVTRYGHQGEFEFWMQGHSIKEIAKRLKRSERSVYDWLHGNRRFLGGYQRSCGSSTTNTTTGCAKWDLPRRVDG